MLFAVVDSHLDAVFPMEMFGEVLCGIDATVLASSAAEREHQVGESALDESLHMEVGQTIDALQKIEQFAVLFQKVDDGLVESRQLLVLLVTTWVVGAAAVEHISASIARRVLGESSLEGETRHIDHQRLAVGLGVVGVLFQQRGHMGAEGLSVHLAVDGCRALTFPHQSVHFLGVTNRLDDGFQTGVVVAPSLCGQLSESGKGCRDVADEIDLLLLRPR